MPHAVSVAVLLGRTQKAWQHQCESLRVRSDAISKLGKTSRAATTDDAQNASAKLAAMIPEYKVAQATAWCLCDDVKDKKKRYAHLAALALKHAKGGATVESIFTSSGAHFYDDAKRLHMEAAAAAEEAGKAAQASAAAEADLLVARREVKAAVAAKIAFQAAATAAAAELEDARTALRAGLKAAQEALNEATVAFSHASGCLDAAEGSHCEQFTRVDDVEGGEDAGSAVDTADTAYTSDTADAADTEDAVDAVDAADASYEDEGASEDADEDADDEDDEDYEPPPVAHETAPEFARSRSRSPSPSLPRPHRIRRTISAAARSGPEPLVEWVTRRGGPTCVDQSPLGEGLFAARDIPRDTILIEAASGERFAPDVAAAAPFVGDDLHGAVMHTGDGGRGAGFVLVDPSGNENRDRALLLYFCNEPNPGGRPNVRYERVTYHGAPCLALRAVEAVPCGTELLVRYNAQRHADSVRAGVKSARKRGRTRPGAALSVDTESGEESSVSSCGEPEPESPTKKRKKAHRRPKRVQYSQLQEVWGGSEDDDWVPSSDDEVDVTTSVASGRHRRVSARTRGAAV